MNLEEYEDYLQYEEEREQVDVLISQGHTRHCACRQVWGDGLCTCNQRGEEGRMDRVIEVVKEAKL